MNTDLIIIGSGPGGYRAAEHAARGGLKVTVFEQEHVGGTCLNRGCIPTKTLCHNAEAAETIRHASELGFPLNNPENSKTRNFEIDMPTIQARKENVVTQLRSGIETLFSSLGINLVRGCAAFKDAHTVVCNGEEYTADNIIIATGSRAKIPPIKGIDLEGVVTSTELLNVQSVPNRLCIIGAGVIGMELASVFSSFGSEVTVIEFLKECLPTLDSDIAKRLRQTISKQGVDFSMQSSVTEIRRNDDGTLTVVFEKKGKPQETVADMVLVATGRAANVETLELEKAGIEYGRQGIVVNEDFETNIPNVYAIGDVNGKCMLAHAATYQGLRVVNRILGKADGIDLNVMPSAIFTSPEAACVGASEDACKASGMEYSCHKSYYRANGKALVINAPEGMAKILTDKEGRIIGCHVFGAHAADLAQEISVLICRKTTIDELHDMVHIHPTLSEVLTGH